jgi:hypothetical protein
MYKVTFVDVAVLIDVKADETQTGDDCGAMSSSGGGSLRGNMASWSRSPSRGGGTC